MPPPMRVATDNCQTINRSVTVTCVARPPTGHTFVARARVPKDRWDRFETNTAQVGSDRSKVLNEFIAWYNREAGAKLPKRPDTD